MKLINCLLLVLCITIFSNLSAQKNKPFLVVGTYNSATSDGIYVYQFDDKTGDLKLISNVKTSNASYLTVSPNGKNVYAVNENGNDQNTGGGVSAFAFDPSSGKLSFINKVSSEGNDPCYIDIDKNGKWLAIANYSGGSAALLPVNADGSIGKSTSQVQFYGKGVNIARQEKPHAHCAQFSNDGQYMAVTDLGTDQLHLYPFDKSSHNFDESHSILTKVTPGAGPRHIVFHPTKKYLYLIEELTGSISVFHWMEKKLILLQNTVMIPPSMLEGNTGADIHVSGDGKFLYASVRGKINEIRSFKILKDGKIKSIGKQDTKGINPRNFTISPSGNYLLVGNQISDNMVVFKRNKKTGLLTDINKTIALGKPVCLKWIE